MNAYASYDRIPASRRYVGLCWVIGLHALLLFLMVSGIFQTTVKLILKKPLEAVVLQEVTLPPLTPPPQPKPLPNEPRPAAPATPQTARSEAAPAPAQAERAPEVAAPAAPTPVAHAAPAEPVHRVAAPAPAPTISTASAEAEYAGRLKALLNANKRYPTGRQASQQRPQGTVKLWFSLNRAGGLLEAGLLEGSDSNLLNDAALSTVRRSSYPPFAAELWPGQEQHRFTVDIDFLPPA